jgi:hypothetical protein
MGIPAWGQSQSKHHPAPQNPSPMKEFVRLHKRIPKQHYSGYSLQIKGLLPKPINVYIPLKTAKHSTADLLIHFHGSKNLVNYAAEQYHGHLIAVTVNLGAGSYVYKHPFASDSTMFHQILDSLKTRINEKLHHLVQFHHIIVSAWSAGYGAVRAILGAPWNRKKIDGILLLDALYASYVPEGKVLAKGGRIDSTEYVNFLKYIRLTVRKHAKKKFLFTYSQIFPGTFVSTKESAHYLLQKLGIKIHPVLKWGPMGMQQLSDAGKNNFEIMGFAGNSAPDHVDHIESLYYFLNYLENL